MPPKKASLEDVISYTPEQYFTDDEIALIRSVFNGKNGAKLVSVIRKVMLPTISDPNLPIEELGKDIFMATIDFKMMPEAEVKSTAVALQLTAKAVLGGLIQLKNIANIKEETESERRARMEKNSSR